ncbi:MAG: YihY/virulence factor BrkB family protein [Sphingomonas bacterium]|nr:YihY/virulence factor BrkB family protein [Sphingomonas bacterium]
MPLSAWREVATRTWRKASKDNAGLVAAGVAFYAFIAIVPTLGAIVLAYGLIATPATVLLNMQSLAKILPGEIATLIADQLIDVVTSSSQRKGLGIAIALGISMFGARNAAGAIIKALNIAYEEEEKRGFLKVTLLALGITGALVVCALIAVGLITAIQSLASLMPNASPVVRGGLRLLAGLLVLGGAATGAATLYRYAPCRANAQWRWLTPGTLLTAVGWLGLFLGFGFYLSHVTDYDATYGSLGAVVALLTFVYLASYIFLFGAELNSELEHQTAKDTTEGSPEPLGERGAWSADHVVSGADGDGKEGKAGPASNQPVVGTASEGSSGKRRAATDPVHLAYLVARATNGVGGLAGMATIGMLALALSTIGLSLLRRKGKAKTGAALLATAAGLSLLRRKND